MALVEQLVPLGHQAHIAPWLSSHLVPVVPVGYGRAMSDELKDQRIPIMMAPSEVRAIDEWMFASRLKSRAEAIRQLIQKGLLYDTTYAVSSAANDLILAFSEGNVPTEVFENWKKSIEEESSAYNAQSQRIKKNIALYASVIQKILDNPNTADEVKKTLRAVLRDEDIKR